MRSAVGGFEWRPEPLFSQINEDPISRDRANHETNHGVRLDSLLTEEPRVVGECRDDF